MASQDSWQEVERDDYDGMGSEHRAPLEWPLFDAPVLSSVRVTGVVDYGGSVYFSVFAVLEGFKWTVLKMYEDFAALHRVLVSEYGVDKGLLPSRGILGRFTSIKKSAAVEMLGGLENMLMTVVQNFPVAPAELFKFLEYPFCDVLSVTQALAKFFYAHGEEVISQDKAVQISPLQIHSINKRLTLPLGSSETGKMKDDFGHLLDFVTNLKKLKISPPSLEKYSIIGVDTLTFDLSMMKNVEVLFIESVNMKHFQGRHLLPGQLVALEVRRTVSALKDMMVVYPPNSADYFDDTSMFEAPPNYTPPSKQAPPSSSTAPPDISKALKWNCLRHANFKLNLLKKIDTSLLLAPFLEKLDLSYNYIELVENLTDLPHLRVLDLSHNKIQSLEDLYTKMGNVTKLNLASNEISSLDGLQKALPLEYIDLSCNEITDVSEVSKLADLPNLSFLLLKGNRIDQSPSYRSQVFSHLPHTDEQVAVDGKKATIDEHYISISLNTPTLGHKRVTSRTADISVDVDERETKEAQDELEDGLSMTNRLEEMRKEGGEKWLAIFNSQRSQHNNSEANDDVVVPKSPKSTKKRRKTGGKHHKHKRGAKKGLEDSLDLELSFSDIEASLSPTLAKLIASKRAEQSDSDPLSVTFQVTVHEYTGYLPSLSTEDMDQLLMNCQKEECSISIDKALGRVSELIMAANKTRAQRDLALLSDLKVHEGKCLALGILFSPFGASSFWVVYCVATLDLLAKLYASVRTGMRSRSISPEATLALLDVTSIARPPLTSSVGGASSTMSGLQPPVAPLSTESTDPDGTVMSPSADESPNLQTVDGIDGVSDIRNAVPPSDLTRNMPTSNIESTGTSSSKDGSSVTLSPPRTPNQTHSPAQTPRNKGSPLLKDVCGFVSSTSTDELRHHKSPSKSEQPSTESPVPKSPVDATHASDSVHLDSAKTASSVSRDLNKSLSTIKQHRHIPLLTRSNSRKILKKPDLGSDKLNNFFKGIVAHDCAEVIVTVAWGGCNISSSPFCEIEVGVIVSDKAVYLLEVLDPDKHVKQPLSWETDNLPLALINSSRLATLTNVSVGIFDQSIRIEFIEKGLMKTYAILPRTYDQMVAITENLKAVLDASKIQHVQFSSQEAIVSPREIDGAVFVNADTSDLLKLKEDLVWPKTMAQVGNFIAVTSKSETVVSSRFESEVKRISEDLAQKFEIVQHMVVGEISSDVLPISVGQPHLRSRALVLTSDSVYLCKESLISWSKERVMPIKIPLPQSAVLDSHPVGAVSSIKICDKALSVVMFTDPVYEFVIKFEVFNEGATTGKSVFRWKLCVHDRQYLDQFINCLTHLRNDLRSNEVKIIHTADSISDIVSLQPISPSLRPSTNRKLVNMTNRSPVFFQSQVLLDFASWSNYQRMKFFKRHVAQAEFLKSDEVPLSVFLAHCSCVSPSQGLIEIEVCVMTSNYGVYLLSDVDSIRKWLDNGGVFSFQRMSLLSKKDSSEVRCFYRMWLSEIKEIKIGFFLLSATLGTAHTKTGSPKVELTIHTDNQFTTISFLGSLSYTLNLRDSTEEEEMSDILSEYYDLVSESIAIQNVKKGSKINVECVPHPESDVRKLKEILISISPSITRNSTIDNVAQSMHILCAQVMLLVEELQIRDTFNIRANPHLVHLTNYGLYVCRNTKDECLSPSVAAPGDLRVKKWCHIDFIEKITTKRPTPSTYSSHTLHISLRSTQLSNLSADGMTFLVQSSELLRYFVHLLCSLWSVRTGKHLPVNAH